MDDHTFHVCKSCGHIHRPIDACVTTYQRS